MSLTMSQPRRPQSIVGSLRIHQSVPRKETNTPLGIESDAESHENSSEDEDDDDLDPPDPEKERLADITDKHLEIIELCLKPKANSETPNFKEEGKALDHFKETYKDVFEASGDDKQTLLHHIAKKRITLPAKPFVYLLRWLLKTYPDLILEVDSKGNTALHTAIVNFKTSFVKEVCEHSQKKEEALGKSGVGGTCLHKALELVSSRPSIMDAVDRMVRVLGNDKDTYGQADGNSPLETVLGKVDEKGNTPLHVALTTLADHELRNDKARSASAPQPDTNLDRLSDLAKQIIQKHPKIVSARNKNSKSPYDCLIPAKEMRSCANLLEKMKQEIMRSLSHDEVIKLLYPDSKDERSIFFDLIGIGPGPIAVGELNGWGKHVRFENILQHVDLPSLTISGGDELLSTTTSDSEASPKTYVLKGPVDFVKMFKWLRKCGVEKVLEVNVEDHEKEPHCDEAIEMALDGLEVEILNWKKPDLCSDVLINSTNGVKELFLYSSGNNDVLRSWSAKDGLAKLQKLEKVHLSIRENYTSGVRLAEYRNAFRTRLKTHCPQVRLYDEKAWWYKYTNEAGSRRDFRTATKHPWLDCMENFAMTVRNNHRHFKDKPEVKVAIIDDGIDESHPDLRERIAGGKSFLKRSDKPDRMIDYWVSPGGHGTQMAKLICQVFPCARLYVIRLDEGVGEKGERQIKIDSAIKAVEWAAQNSVHIISMSWSIHSSDVQGRERRELEDSIKNAYENGITMFCAASDHGRTSESAAEDDLPAAFFYPLKIGAARADGYMWGNVGYEKIDYYLPGHKIVLDDYRPAEGQPQSGSSLATAVAAGLAALVQYCSSFADDESKANPALGRKRTEQAFKKLCTLPTPEKFPQVEKVFGDTGNLYRPKEVKERYQQIANELQLY